MQPVKNGMEIFPPTFVSRVAFGMNDLNGEPAQGRDDLIYLCLFLCENANAYFRYERRFETLFSFCLPFSLQALSSLTFLSKLGKVDTGFVKCMFVHLCSRV